MSNHNITLTDIEEGQSKTIAVNYIHKNKAYPLPGWTVELDIHPTNGAGNKYSPIIKADDYATFYLSPEETSKLSTLVSRQTSASSVITNAAGSFLTYEINLVKDYTDSKRQISPEEEIKINLCGGTVNIVRGN